MAEKRRSTARDSSAAKRRRSEAASTAPPARRKTASATPNATATPVPESFNKKDIKPTASLDPQPLLPTKIQDGVPLPTVSTPQPSLLSLEEYQTYAESAVIGTAIQCSRARWLQDPCFEKYWVKPSKRKQLAQPDQQPFQNPPRDTMVKLGPCSIVIEPHHFEAMLYTVKGNEPPKQQRQQQQQPRPVQQPQQHVQKGQGGSAVKYQQTHAQPQVQGQTFQQQTFHQYQPPRQAIQPTPTSTPVHAPPPVPHGHPQPPAYQSPRQPVANVSSRANGSAGNSPAVSQQQPAQQPPQQPYSGQQRYQQPHSQVPRPQFQSQPQAQTQLQHHQQQQQQQQQQQPQTQSQQQQQQLQQRPLAQSTPPYQQQHRQQQQVTQHPHQPPPQQHPPPPPPPKTAQDPVIQMLATRAAADPELKALMQLVASKRADQAQLRRFQAHIDELHAIIAQRNRDAAAQAAAAQQAQQHAQRPQVQQQQQGHGANLVFYSPAQSTGAVSGSGPLRLLPQAQQQQRYQEYQGSPGTGMSHVPTSQGQNQSTCFSQQQQAHHHLPPQPMQRPAHRTHPLLPPKPEPQAIVFEFLTPSSSQFGSTGGGHGGAGGKDSMYSHVSAGDRYLFPANTILDYFPGGTTVIASFLAIKKVDEREPYVDLSMRQNVRGKYQKKGKKDKEKDPETPLDTDETAQLGKDDTEAHASAKKDIQEDKDGELKSSPCIKEYYQPVTMRLHAPNLRILEPLAKIVNPPAQVRKYMDEIMDRLPRADIEYLALRLPREGSSAAQGLGEGKEE